MTEQGATKARKSYSDIKEAREKAREGDLQYFIDKKESMGEERFKAFLARANYKQRKNEVVPNNSIFKEALSQDSLEICKFLLENGLSPYQGVSIIQMQVDHYNHRNDRASKILKLLIDAGADLLKPPFIRDAIDEKVAGTIPDYFERKVLAHYTSVMSFNDIDSLELLYNYFQNYDWDKYIRESEINDLSEKSAKAIKGYLTSLDWIMYLAVRNSWPQCAEWALDKGVDVNGKAYSYIKEKSKMKTSEFILLKAAEAAELCILTLQRNYSAIAGNQQYFPVENVEGASYWEDAREVLRLAVEKTGLKAPNQSPVFMNFLQKQLNIDPNKPVPWDPDAFFTAMKGLRVCWAVMETHPLEECLNVKDSKGHDMAWYIANMPKMTTLDKPLPTSKEQRHRYGFSFDDYNKSMQDTGEHRRRTFRIMQDFADLCQVKYDRLLNLTNKQVEVNDFLMNYEI